MTLLGSAMIITGLLEKWMEKVPPVVGLAGSMFLFYFTRYAADGYLQLGHWLITLPGFLYANYFTAYLGFYPFGFFSTDYFPLTPWLFLFWAGFTCIIWQSEQRRVSVRCVVRFARRWGGWGGTR